MVSIFFLLRISFISVSIKRRKGKVSSSTICFNNNQDGTASYANKFENIFVANLKSQREDRDYVGHEYQRHVFPCANIYIYICVYTHKYTYIDI